MPGTVGSFGAWVAASHPLPGLVVTVVAAGLAVTAGHSPGGVAGVTVAVFAGQLSVGWLNDVVDADRDAVVGRTDKPVAAGRVGRRAVGRGVVVAAVLAVGLSLLSGVPATAAHVGALLSAWAYDLGVKATAWSIVPYAVSFGLLPAFATIGATGHWPPWWITVGAAVLGSAAHVANVLPDIDDDTATGVVGLPHRIGATASRFLAAALVLAASVVLVAGPPGAASALGIAALVVACLVVGGGLVARRRAAFHAVLVVAVLDVVLLLATGA
ncbi:UbiA family prenyltransferase [Actinophytocola gossypii]|uniref:UbiA family prenyltransferase n=1 Tax=Actinophytocola gossypii TaxID=2812003 RepID=A0ABT2J5I8_9PSEU|nr:UbiA family prenyltransferase [Actinophytocola gossypii]MCT2583124.1 UbiA family prenyltransferase [Actinophytocola gossypii]